MLYFEICVKTAEDAFLGVQSQAWYSEPLMTVVVMVLVMMTTAVGLAGAYVGTTCGLGVQL
jgi:hypothetical protein